MSIDPSILRALQAAGASTDMIIAAVEAAAAIEESHKIEKRAKDAARQRKSRSSRNVTVTPRDTCDSTPPNDNISNPPVFDNSNELSGAKPDLGNRVAEAWNADTEGTPLPKARKITGTRLKHLRCRIKDHGEDAVFTAIRNMAASDFHSGRDGKWLGGSLGWLLETDGNFTKMLEREPAAKPDTAKVNADIAAQFYAKWGGPPPDTPRPFDPPGQRDRNRTAKPIGQLIPFNRDAA